MIDTDDRRNEHDEYETVVTEPAGGSWMFLPHKFWKLNTESSGRKSMWTCKIQKEDATFVQICDAGLNLLVIPKRDILPSQRITEDVYLEACRKKRASMGVQQ